MRKSVLACVVACGIVMLACSRQPRPGEALQEAPPKAGVVARPDAPPMPQPPTASPALSVAAPTQPAAQTKVVASDHAEGPFFHVGGQNFTFVKHVQNIEGKASADDSTVEWWELRDAAGNAIYRRAYPVGFQNGNFDETENVDARELKAGFGKGILVEGGELPSAPNGGWWIQIFGLMNGKLTPLSGALRTDGAFLGEQVESYRPSPIVRAQQPQAVSHDVLKFRVWTGKRQHHLRRDDRLDSGQSPPRVDLFDCPGSARRVPLPD